MIASDCPFVPIPERLDTVDEHARWRRPADPNTRFMPPADELARWRRPETVAA